MNSISTHSKLTSHQHLLLSMTSSISLQMLIKSNLYLINRWNLKRILLRLKTTRRVSVKSSKIKSTYKILPRILHKLITMLECLTLMIFSSDRSLQILSYKALELKRDSLLWMLMGVTKLVTAIEATNRISLIRCCLAAIQSIQLDQLLLIIKFLNHKIKPFRQNHTLCQCLDPHILWWWYNNQIRL